MIRKLFLLSATTMLLALAPLASVFAAYNPFGGSCDGVSGSSLCQDINQSRGQDRILGSGGIVTRVTQAVVFITATLSVIIIIIGGFRYIISSGDSNSTKSAKDSILYALVGLVVAVFAQIIVSFVLSNL